MSSREYVVFLCLQRTRKKQNKKNKKQNKKQKNNEDVNSYVSSTVQVTRSSYLLAFFGTYLATDSEQCCVLSVVLYGQYFPQLHPPSMRYSFV